MDAGSRKTLRPLSQLSDRTTVYNEAPAEAKTPLQHKYQLNANKYKNKLLGNKSLTPKKAIDGVS